MSCIFLAREFGASVWATDSWIPATENRKRIVEADISGLVTPVHAEAHKLPFAADFFDAIVSFDAYQYFGTAGLHLGYLVDFLKPGGKIGVVMPTTTRGDRLRPATRDETVGHRWTQRCFGAPVAPGATNSTRTLSLRITGEVFETSAR